jgi:DNA repair exonuclease SbcCD nuclease subunit
MTRVIHTGDTHVGYRQYNRPERRQDFLDAFAHVLDDAAETGVDAVVHAGDLFHDRSPDLQDVLGVLSALRRLDDAGIPFLAVVGNHESKRDAQWLDLFASLGLAERLGREPRMVGDVALYGLDFVPRSRRSELAYDFEPADADHAALVAHGQFEPLAPATSDWDVRDVLAASPAAFDAVLLGDEHAHGMEEIEDAWVTYCGSTERASTDERAERGYNIVDFDGEVRLSRRGIPARPFVFVDVTLGSGEGVDRVRERLGQHDVADAVVAVTVEGEGEPVAPAIVEEFARERGALVARVVDRREFDAEEDTEVRFTDPDAAVRERVREMGLSGAARDVDEVVRESTVADSNVRSAVTERVNDLIDDPDAFATGDGVGASGRETADAGNDGAEDGTGAGGDGSGQATWGEFE